MARSLSSFLPREPCGGGRKPRRALDRRPLRRGWASPISPACEGATMPTASWVIRVVFPLPGGRHHDWGRGGRIGASCRGWAGLKQPARSPRPGRGGAWLLHPWHAQNLPSRSAQQKILLQKHVQSEGAGSLLSHRCLSSAHQSLPLSRSLTKLQGTPGGGGRSGLHPGP